MGSYSLSSTFFTLLVFRCLFIFVNVPIIIVYKCSYNLSKAVSHFSQCSERQRIYRERGMSSELTETFDDNTVGNMGETDDEEVA